METFEGIGFEFEKIYCDKAAGVIDEGNESLKPPYPMGNGPHTSQWMRKRGRSARFEAFRGNLSRLILAKAHMRQFLTWMLSIGNPVVARSSPLTSIWPTRRWKNPTS